MQIRNVIARHSTTRCRQKIAMHGHSTKHGLDWTGQLDWTVGLDNWTGQLDWTIGLDF